MRTKLPSADWCAYQDSKLRADRIEPSGLRGRIQSPDSTSEGNVRCWPLAVLPQHSRHLILALVFLLVRAPLSQMDVPTRTSYVMAVVIPRKISATRMSVDIAVLI